MDVDTPAKTPKDEPVIVEEPVIQEEKKVEEVPDATFEILNNPS